MKLEQLFSPVDWNITRIKYSGKTKELELRTRRTYETSQPFSKITTKHDLEVLGNETSNPEKLKILFKDRSQAEISVFKSNIKQLTQLLGPKKALLFKNFFENCEEISEPHLSEEMAVSSLSEEIGNKAANLVFMRQRLKTGEIPPFLPIPYRKIKTFLEKHRIDLTAVINQVKKLDEAAGEPLCQESRTHLRLAQKQVIQLFSEHPFESTEIDDFLKSLPFTARIMVRSSNREDSKENPNAGGNLTKIGVKKDKSEISRSIGEDIASVLSEKSLVQTLRAGQSIYQNPFFSVLLQQMVGEDPAIATNGSFAGVTSGVAFTTEPEGRYTPLVQVQASFGQGEGVVASRVACDTFYILPENKNDSKLTIRSILRNKPDRFVPTEEGGEVKKIANARIQQSISSLPDSVLPRIHAMAAEIREMYRMPMDIEWVYDWTLDKIWVVQARPLQQLKELSPSYLNLKNIQDYSKGRLIVSGGSCVRQIDRVEEILIVDELSDALDSYVAMKETQRDSIKGIICKNWAATTSHEATVFRGEAIPVIQLAETEGIEQALVQGKKILLDPQQATVAVLERVQTGNSFVEMGWKNYPIAKEQSLRPIRLTREDFTERLKTLIISDSTSNLPFSCLLELIGDPKQPEKALIALSDVVKAVIKMLEKYPASEFFPAKTVFMNFVMAACELKARLTEDPVDPMGVLNAKHWLETTLSQEGDGVLNANSFQDYFTDLKAQKKVEKLWKMQAHALDDSTSLISETEAKALLAEYLNIAQLQFTPEGQAQFEKCVITLAASRNKHDLGNFNRLLKSLQQNGALALFFNDHFSLAWQESGQEVKGCLTRLSQEWVSALNGVATLIPLKNLLDNWQSRIPQWSNPEAFDKLYAEFQKDLQPWLEEDELLKCLTDPTKSRLERTIAQNFAVRLINCVDQSIKSLKGNKRCEAALRIARFSKLLEPCHAMMEHFVNAIPKELYLSWIKLIVENKELSTRPHVLQMITNALRRCQKETEENQLLPSGSCNVASCKIASGAAFDRHFDPKKVTLEDLFSLMHQNILKAASALNQEKGLTLSELPPKAKQLGESFKQLGVEVTFRKLSAKTDLTSIDTSGSPNIALAFNMPLSNHSATLDINYNMLNKTSTVSFNLFGHDHSNRMSRLLPFAFLRSSLYGLQLAGTPSCRNGHWQAKWKFDSEVAEEQLTHLKKILEELVLMTFTTETHMFEPSEEEIRKILQQPTEWFYKLGELFENKHDGSAYSTFTLQEVANYLFVHVLYNPALADKLVALVARVPQLVGHVDQYKIDYQNIAPYIEALKNETGHLWQFVIACMTREEAEKNARILLNQGISPNVICPNGQTPLSMALKHFKDEQLIEDIRNRCS